MPRKGKDLARAVGGGPKVVARHLQARSVYTFGPDDPIWSDCSQKVLDDLGDERDIRVEGAIFRLQPPEGKDPAWLKKALENLGAAAVRIVQARRSKVVAKKVEFSPARAAREVVMEMAEESHFEDKAALRAALENALARAGL